MLSRSQSLSSQPDISPVNSQCDEGTDSKRPGSVSSQSGAGYKAKFLGALDDLEKSASPQVRSPTLMEKLVNLLWNVNKSFFFI